MAFIAGKDSAITIDGTALTSYVDSMSLSRDINTLTVTSFGDDNEAYIAGVLDSIDIGSFDATADQLLLECLMVLLSLSISDQMTHQVR